MENRQQKGKSTIISLIEALKDEEKCAKAAEALGKLGDSSAIAPLINTLTKNHSKESKDAIKQAVFEALVNIGQPAVGPLLAFLNSNLSLYQNLVDTRQKTKKDLRKSGKNIRKFGSYIAANRISAKEMQNELLKEKVNTEVDELSVKLMLKDIEKSLIKLGAVEPAGKIFRDYADILLNYSDRSIRIFSLEIIGRYGNSSFLSKLYQVLESDTDDLVRSLAAKYIGEIRDPSSFDHLVTKIRDPSSLVRRNSISSLGAIGDQRAVDALVDVLPNSEHRESEEILRALVKLGNSHRATPAVIQYLDDNPKSVLAISTLGQIGDSRAIDPLVKIYNSDRDGINRFAARALNQLYVSDRIDEKSKKTIELLFSTGEVRL